MKPVLYMPFRQLHRRLLQAAEGAPADEELEVAQVAEFDPCQNQTMARTRPYLIGLLLWPGGHVSRWLNATGDIQNPCTNATFAAQLAINDEAFVAVFRLKVEDLALLRIDVSGKQRLATITSAIRVETAAVYNQYAVSVPRVITSYSTDFAGATGFAVYLPVIVSGDMSLAALLTPPTFRTQFAILDQATCARCDRLQDAYTNMLRQGTAYFNSSLVNLNLVPPDLYNFQCINNVTCAWGLGWCTACLKSTLDRTVLSNYDVDSLLFDPNPESMNSVKLTDFTEAVADFENICVTVCSTVFSVGWVGVDQFGQQMSSAMMFNHASGFDLMTLFPQVYGINGTLLRKFVREVEDAPVVEPVVGEEVLVPPGEEIPPDMMMRQGETGV